MHFDIPPLQNQIFTQRAEKAFQFIRQVVNLLGKVGTSPFFRAPRYSALAESNLYSEGRKIVFVYPAGSESARQGWNESVFPCTSIFRPCRIKSLPEGSESVSVHPAGSESARRGWNESVFPCILPFHTCRIKSLLRGQKKRFRLSGRQ